MENLEKRRLNNGFLHSCIPASKLLKSRPAPRDTTTPKLLTQKISALNAKPNSSFPIQLFPRMAEKYTLSSPSRGPLMRQSP